MCALFLNMGHSVLTQNNKEGCQYLTVWTLIIFKDVCFVVLISREDSHGTEKFISYELCA